MNLGNPIVQWAARPIQRAWLAWSRPTWGEVPPPTDSPIVEVAGDRAVRVLLIGDGPTLGMGVTSNELAIPGHLARQVSRATGRGVEVSVIADDTLTVSTIARRYAASSSGRYDVVVVLLGTSDAIKVTSTRRWSDQLTALFDRLRLDGDPRIILVGVPPVARLLFVRGLPKLIARRHAELLNRASADLSVCTGVTFVPFLPPAEPDGERYRSAKTYSEWAAVISPSVVQALSDTSLGTRS